MAQDSILWTNRFFPLLWMTGSSCYSHLLTKGSVQGFVNLLPYQKGGFIGPINPRNFLFTYNEDKYSGLLTHNMVINITIFLAFWIYLPWWVKNKTYILSTLTYYLSIVFLCLIAIWRSSSCRVFLYQVSQSLGFSWVILFITNLCKHYFDMQLKRQFD